MIATKTIRAIADLRTCQHAEKCDKKSGYTLTAGIASLSMAWVCQNPTPAVKSMASSVVKASTTSSILALAKSDGGIFGMFSQFWESRSSQWGVEYKANLSRNVDKTLINGRGVDTERDFLEFIRRLAELADWPNIFRYPPDAVTALQTTFCDGLLSLFFGSGSVGWLKDPWQSRWGFLSQISQFTVILSQPRLWISWFLQTFEPDTRIALEFEANADLCRLSKRCFIAHVGLHFLLFFFQLEALPSTRGTETIFRSCRYTGSGWRRSFKLIKWGQGFVPGRRRIGIPVHALNPT